MHYAIDSDATYLFTLALSRYSSYWTAGYGESIKWPPTKSTQNPTITNPKDMTAFISANQYSIGFVSLPAAADPKNIISIAQVRALAFVRCCTLPKVLTDTRECHRLGNSCARSTPPAHALFLSLPRHRWSVKQPHESISHLIISQYGSRSQCSVALIRSTAVSLT